MIDGFEIKCKKCGNIAIDIKGTAVAYGAKVRVRFTCLSCDSETEVPVTQNSLSDFEEDLIKKKEKVETLGDLLRANIIYSIDGKKYRKVGRQEIIEEGAMQSWGGSELRPILNPFSIGDVPANFSDGREFYNPI